MEASSIACLHHVCMRVEPPRLAPQVGAVVEVKNPDGVYQEATINKLTDASIYTVGESVGALYSSSGSWI